MKAEEVKAEVSLVADGTLQSLNCDNCFILEKKLDRSRKWNRFFKEKLINIDKILHILREFEIEKQKNLDLQLAYDQRSREWEYQQQELTRMFTEIQPLRERLKIAEESAKEERKLRIKHEDMVKSLHTSIKQLQAQISHMRNISDPMYAEGLEKKLASCRADNKKYRNNVECCHVEISELRSYNSNIHSQIEKVQKKLYKSLCIAKKYGELLLIENDEEWELVKKSLEDITGTLRSQYDVYYKEESNRLRGLRIMKSLILEFDIWVHTDAVKPIPIFKEEHFDENVDASDTELEAMALEKYLSDKPVKNGKENVSASSKNVPITNLKKEKVCSNSLIKSPIIEKGKRNVNKNKVLAVKNEIGSLVDAGKKEKYVTSPCTQNFGLADGTENDAKSLCSKKKLSIGIGGALSLLKSDEKEQRMPNTQQLKSVTKLNEISNHSLKKDKFENLQGTKSDSSFEKVDRAKLNECQEDEFISDSSEEEGRFNQSLKGRKAHVKTFKVAIDRKQMKLEKSDKKLSIISTKNSIVEKGKINSNRSKVLVKSEINSVKDSAKKEINLTSPFKNFGLADGIENDLNTMSSKILTDKIEAASLLVPDEKKLEIPYLSPSIPDNNLKEILEKSQIIKSDSLLLTEERFNHNKLNERQEEESISDSSDEERLFIKPHKRRKTQAKTSKIASKRRMQSKLGNIVEKSVQKVMMGPPNDLSLFHKKIEVVKENSDKVNEPLAKFSNDHILNVDLLMSESETSESEIEENITTPSKNKFIPIETSDVGLINKNQMKFPKGKFVEKLPMDPPAIIPARVDKVGEEAKSRMEIKRIVEEMSISPIHHFTLFSDDSSSDDEEVKPKRLTIKARRGSQGFKPSVCKTWKEEVQETKDHPETTNLNGGRITRSKYRLSLSKETSLNKSDDNSNDVLYPKKKSCNSKPGNLKNTSSQIERPDSVKCNELDDTNKPLSSPKRKRKQSGTEISKLEKLSKIEIISHTSPVIANKVENVQRNLNDGIINQNVEKEVSQCGSENQDKEKLHNVTINSALFEISLSMCSDLEDSPKKPSTLYNEEQISTSCQRKLDSLFGCDDEQEKTFETDAAHAGKGVDSSVYKTDNNLHGNAICKNTDTSSDFPIEADNIENNCNKVSAPDLNLIDSKIVITAKVGLSTAGGQSELSPEQSFSSDASSGSEIILKDNEDILKNYDRSDTEYSLLKEPVFIDGQHHSNFGKHANVKFDNETKLASTFCNASTTESFKELHTVDTKFEPVLIHDKASLDSQEFNGQSMASNDPSKKNIITVLNMSRNFSIFEGTNVNVNKSVNSSDSPARIEKYSDVCVNNAKAFDRKLFISVDDQADNDDAHSYCSSPPYDALAMDISFSEENICLESCDSDNSSFIFSGNCQMDGEKNGRPQDVSKIKNTSLPNHDPNYSGMPLSKCVIDKTGNDIANTDASKPILFNFYKERIGDLDEPEECNLPLPLLIQSIDEPGCFLMENNEESVNQDDAYKKMELRFIHAPLLSAFKLEESDINFKEIEASFNKLALLVHKPKAPVDNKVVNNFMSIRNMDVFLDTINKQPSQDSNIKLQPFVRCVISELLEKDFLEDINNRQYTPETIKKCLLISRLLEINLKLPEFYADNLINMAAHKLILTKTLRTNSLSSLTAWVMTSFFLQYRHYNQMPTKEGDNLICWGRTFLFDLLFHNVGTAHKAILTAMNSSGKKAFIHMASHRKSSTLEEVIFWIIYHGNFIGDSITRTTLLEEVKRKLGLYKVISENPEELIKNIIILLTDKSPEKDEMSYASSSLLLLLQWTPFLTSQAIFNQLQRVLTDDQQSDRAELSAIKAIIGDLVEKCTWSDEDKNDFHQKLDAELAKVIP